LAGQRFIGSAVASAQIMGLQHKQPAISMESVRPVNPYLEKDFSTINANAFFLENTRRTTNKYRPLAARA
jgi:hypothetical protein